jgi:hypothetical protein
MQSQHGATKLTAVALATRQAADLAPSGVLASPTVRAYLAERGSDVTAAVYNLVTGATAVWRPGTREYTASIVKVDILAALLHQHQHKSSGAALPPTEAKRATTMIEQSNNAAATDLWASIGQQKGLVAFNSLLPLTSTTPGTDGHWGGTLTTAQDQVQLLRAIVLPNGVLDPSSREYELSLMEHVEPSEAWGISYGPPSGVSVALKNGWLPLVGDGDWQVNSIGWVDGDGRDYVIAVLTKDNPDEVYGIATIEGLSSLVWAALAH